MKKYGIFIIVFIIALFIRLIAIEQKTSMHFDAPFSLISSTPNNLTPEGDKKLKITWFAYNFQKNKNYSGYEIKKALFYNNPSLKSTLHDLWTIRTHNIDTPHPNLYYSILRIWNMGLLGTNYKEIIKRDCLLNIAFFSLAFFFMYKLLSLIKKDTKFISLGLIFGFLSTGSIITTLMIRPYAIMQTLMVLTTLIFCILYKKITENNILNTKEILIYSFCFTLFLLTGYFPAIYLSLLFITLFILCFIYKKYDIMKKLCIISFLTVIFLVILYPDYFYNGLYNNDHIPNISENMVTVFSKTAILEIYNLIYDFLINYIFLVPVIIFTACALIYPIIEKIIQHKPIIFFKKEDLLIWLIILISITWVIIAAFITPHKKIHYFTPVCPIITLLLVIICHRFKKYVSITLVIVFITCTVFNFLTKKEEFLLYLAMGEKYKLIHEKNTPIVIHKPRWNTADYLMYINNDDIIRYEKDLPPIENYIFEKYILITPDKYKNPKISVKTYNNELNIYFINIGSLSSEVYYNKHYYFK